MDLRFSVICIATLTASSVASAQSATADAGPPFTPISDRDSRKLVYAEGKQFLAPTEEDAERLRALVGPVGTTGSQAAPPDVIEANVRLGPGVARPTMRWILTVRTDNGPQSATIAEYQEGDVSMPQGTPWKCRWEGVHVYRDRALLRNTQFVRDDHPAYFETIVVYRSLWCSTDGFKTAISHTGSYSISDGRLGVDPSYAEANLRWIGADGYGNRVLVEMRPCPLTASPQLPLCPINIVAITGKPALTK
jgi:hypothetical protein